MSPYYSNHVSGLPGYDASAPPITRPDTTSQYPSGSTYGLSGPNLGAPSVNPMMFMAGYGSGGVSGGMGQMGGGAFGPGAGPGEDQGFLSRPGAMGYAGNQPQMMGQGGIAQQSMFGQPMGGYGMPNMGSYNQVQYPQWGQAQSNPNQLPWMQQQQQQQQQGGGQNNGGTPGSSDPSQGFYDNMLSGGGGGGGGGGMGGGGGGGSTTQGNTGGGGGGGFSFFQGPAGTATQQPYVQQSQGNQNLPNSMAMLQQSPQSQMPGGGQPQQTFGAFNAQRPATSPGNLHSQAAAQYPVSPMGYREGYALPQPGYGGPSTTQFNPSGQAAELPSGLGGSRTVAGLTGGNQQNYLMTGQQNQGGGYITSPGDVDFFLEQGILTPEQADVMRQVGEKNQTAGNEMTTSMGSYAPSSSGYNQDNAYGRRFQGA